MIEKIFLPNDHFFLSFKCMVRATISCKPCFFFVNAIIKKPTAKIMPDKYIVLNPNVKEPKNDSP